MKITVEQAINAVGELSALAERHTKEGDIIKGVIIPASKSKAGFWLGRLQTKLEVIRKDFIKSQEALIKELGESMTESIKDEEGNSKEIVIPGQFVVKKDKVTEYNKAIVDIYTQEEEIIVDKLAFEDLEGIAFPASFWAPMSLFINDPK